MFKKISAIAILSFALLLISSAQSALAQSTATASPAAPYLKMAPIDQYLMPDRAAEVALARSAAPVSISRDADILVLGPHGFETAVKGKNGFVCIVGRSFTATVDAEFWNPKVRVPMCVNPPAAHSYLQRIAKETAWALAGRTPAQIAEAVPAAVASREFPPMEPGSMCYMMSRQGYGGDTVPHWPSHLMFFFTDTDPAVWGANLAGSPVTAVSDPVEHLTQFVVVVQQWSDGAPYQEPSAPDHHH